MPSENASAWSMLVDLAVGAIAGAAGLLVRVANKSEPWRLKLALLWGLPSAGMLGTAGYALGGFLDLNEYGRFLFAFVFGYLGEAALHDLVLSIIRSKTGANVPTRQDKDQT